MRDICCAQKGVSWQFMVAIKNCGWVSLKQLNKAGHHCKHDISCLHVFIHPVFGCGSVHEKAQELIDSDQTRNCIDISIA